MGAGSPDSRSWAGGKKMAVNRGKVRLGLALALVMCVSASTATAAITVSIVPASSTVYLDGANDPLVLTLQISNPEQLAVRGWILDLLYDPAVFEPITGKGTVSSEGFELGSYIPGFSTMDPTVYWSPFVEHDYVAPDIARAFIVNFGSSTGNALTGVLCFLALDATGPSPSTTISIGGISEIELDTGPASDVVFNPVQITVLDVPEPTCLMMLGLGLAGLVRRRR
jgi:hypothetical protein